MNDNMINEKATVSTCSYIGKGTKVWQYANICRQSIIGEHVSVGPYTNIDGAIIHDRTVLSMWSSVPPGWEVGENCFIGPQVILVNDMWPAAHKEGFDVADLICVNTKKRIGIIEDWAVIGAQSTLMAGIRIGEGAMVSAGSIVSRDVPANKLLTRGGEIIDIPSDIKNRRLRFVCD